MEIIQIFKFAETLGKDAIDLAKQLDYNRVIVLQIQNRTYKTLTYDCQYFDCGYAVQAPPPYIEPGQRVKLKVSKKFGSYGVKGMFLYRYGSQSWQRICFYFQNPVKGPNCSGIKYYENWTTQSSYDFYCDIPKVTSGQQMVQNFNDHTFRSLITGGDNAGACYIVTHNS